MAPELERVAAEAIRRYVIAKLSTEDVPAVAQRFNISAIPTLVLFKSGHEVVRQAGAIPASAIRRLLQEAVPFPMKGNGWPAWE
jgi:thioredoxin 2